ncbi:MAG TPA: SDR family oxidoreductase [Ignavibacteria bacterium]|nr:SDR family oxidoreductase [Ignavibacteria bacterium]
MFNFKNKTVLITGGSKGIGAACVELFYKYGAETVFTYNSDERSAQKLFDKLGKPKKVKFYHLDFSNTNELKNNINKILKEIRGVNILVNNAGVWEKGKIEEMNLDEWRKTIDINLTSAFLITQAIIPFMKKKKYGKIINISSTAGQRGEKYYSHYASSKGGIISFTKSLAAELGKDKINVNAVAPGWVDTAMTKEIFLNKEMRKKIKEDSLLKRIAKPIDVAYPVVFLASDFAQHITGEVLSVNGGSILCG